jgi:hypothetical protein
LNERNQIGYVTLFVTFRGGGERDEMGKLSESEKARKEVASIEYLFHSTLEFD